MQFRIKRDLILPVLNRGARTAAHNPLQPHLSHLLVATEEGRLRIFATNLQWSLTYWVPCDQILRPGTGAIPAQLVTNFVQELPPEVITFEQDEQSHVVHMSCDRFQADVHGMEATNFPTPPTPTGVPLTSVAASVLNTSINQVRFAAGADNTKALGCVLHHFHDQQLTLVGADGFRMAVRSAPLDTLTLPATLPQDRADLEILVPAAVLAELANNLPEAKPNLDPQVQISITPDNNHLIYTTAQFQFAVRLAEGNYPRYRSFMAQQEGWKTRAAVVTSELLKALRIAASFARDNQYIVVLDLIPGADPTQPGQITVRAAGEVGSTMAHMEATIEGPAANIAFSAKLLTTTIQNLSTPTTLIEIRNPQSAGTIRPLTAGEEHLCLLMPMHLNSARPTATEASNAATANA
jgi:DNA polymerase-3 subunit beta